ncbi:MAG: hypothetical protein R6V62_05645 [Candidatus Fermentibacteraceae bacterium]
MRQKERLAPLGAAVVFLALAFTSGNVVRDEHRVDISGNLSTIGSGIGRLRRIAASALYLQMDDYHHIGMYQGQSWATITDYLPQAWLVSWLDPGFSVVFVDAANHLAVNLGMVEEGLDLAREGIRHNPDSLDIAYEYAFLLFETGAGSSGEIALAVLHYHELLRLYSGDQAGPFRESSASLIAAEALSTTMPEFSELYARRAEFISIALRSGLYYPGYLSLSPEQSNGGNL